MSRKKVIYILGLGHSGSTVLGAMLGKHKDAVSLGEVYKNLSARRTVNPYTDTERMCSCGALMHRCPLWSDFLEKTKNFQGGFIERYKELLDTSFLDNYTTVIDATKSIDKLKMLLSLKEEGKIDLHVVFLLKDVREWIVSERRRREKGGFRYRPRIFDCVSWYRKNKELKQYLVNTGIPYTQVSYLNMCLFPEGVTARVFSDAGLNAGVLDISQEPNAHITYGNHVKADKNALFSIHYDSRWMSDYWATVSISFLPHIYKWNKKNVHAKW